MRFSILEYLWIYKCLWTRHDDMLKNKDLVLGELYRLCDDNRQRKLIQDLIRNFHYMVDDEYSKALQSMAEHILSLGYDPSRTAIVSFALEDSPDGSQAVLQELKLYISIVSQDRNLSENHNYLLLSRFDKIERYYNKGYRHFIAVDDFSGSGQTVIMRHEKFEKLKLKDASIDFCVIAVMKDALNKIRNKNIPFWHKIAMDKAISDHYSGQESIDNINSMLALEQKLAATVNRKNLADFSLGYRRSESIFTRKNRNIPNNVFPLFWWKRYADNSHRLTMFTRVQDGY